jgi:histidine ammonia-lyase
LQTSSLLSAVHQRLRAKVAFYDKDRLFAPDIEAAKQLVLEGDLSASCQELFTGLYSA